MCETLYDLLKSIIDLLPDSPFQMLDNSPISKYLVYINYFVDFAFIVDTLTLWLVAVAGYYTYSVILRMIKTID
ncbi:hypothetical protein KGF34_00910 [Ruminococcus sp. FMBCY1]|nr:hypothetical protein KGF34_00910 [Ruminococcus sp. FMBCY1]